jgi:ATP-dependent Clp protease ATP-binding subunit ClpX
MKPPNAYCSFCRKRYTEVGPLVEGPGDVYICGECIELCQSVIDQERRRRKPVALPVGPEQIREKLDRLVSGQDEVKQALARAAGARNEGGGRVLLFGPSGSAKILLARALAHVLEVPFAAGDASGLIKSRRDSVDVLPLFYHLLRASDFDIEAAQRAVVFVDGAERPDAQAALLQFWRDRSCCPVENLQHMDNVHLAVHGMLFVCGGTFTGLDEASARSGRPPEQPVTVEDLTATGVQPEWAGCLSGIARVTPLDETNLVRMVHWVDFRRCDTGPDEAGQSSPL